jgi:hypothetical protein
MPQDFKEAVDFLEVNKAHLGVTDPDGYIDDLRIYLGSKIEDSQKASVLIAVDASKSLMNIGVAFFAALGAFALNYRSTHGFSFSFPIICLGLSAGDRDGVQTRSATA